jgi:hypothetical protein
MTKAVAIKGSYLVGTADRGFKQVIVVIFILLQPVLILLLFNCCGSMIQGWFLEAAHAGHGYCHHLKPTGTWQVPAIAAGYPWHICGWSQPCCNERPGHSSGVLDRLPQNTAATIFFASIVSIDGRPAPSMAMLLQQLDVVRHQQVVQWVL